MSKENKEFDESPEKYRISRRLSFIVSQYNGIFYMLDDLFKNGVLKADDIEIALDQFAMLSDQTAELLSYAKVIQGSDL